MNSEGLPCYNADIRNGIVVAHEILHIPESLFPIRSRIQESYPQIGERQEGHQVGRAECVVQGGVVERIGPEVESKALENAKDDLPAYRGILAAEILGADHRVWSRCGVRHRNSAVPLRLTGFVEVLEGRPGHSVVRGLLHEHRSEE